MSITFDDSEDFLDSFIHKLRQLRFGHPLWMVVPPPDTIDVNIHPEYLHAVKAAHYDASARNRLLDYSGPEEEGGVERFRGAAGDYRLHVSSDWPEMASVELCLRIRPKAVVSPREIDEDIHLPTIFIPSGLVGHWFEQEAKRWPPPMVRIRCGPRTAVGDDRFSQRAEIFIHTETSKAARIKLLNNLAVVAPLCDVERGTAAWGRLTRSFSQRRLCS